MNRTRCAAACALTVALAATGSPVPARADDCDSPPNGQTRQAGQAGQTHQTRQVAEASGQRIVFASRPWPIAVGQPFALDITVCAPPSAIPGAAPPQLLRLDADMPAHRHGMNYRPGITPLGAGRYRAEGLMFHMPGSWRLRFELDAGAGVAPQQLSKVLTIE